MHPIPALFGFAAFVTLCIIAFCANEQAALSGAYAGADQYLSSILPH